MPQKYRKFRHFFKSNGHYKLLQSQFFVLQHVAIPDYNISFIALPPTHPAMQHMPPPHLLILRQPLRLLNQMLNLYTSLVINHIIIRTSSSALGFARFWQVVPYSCQIPHSL